MTNSQWLGAAVSYAAERGYRVISQSDYRVQMLRPKQKSCLLVIILLLLGILPGLVYLALSVDKSLLLTDTGDFIQSNQGKRQMQAVSYQELSDGKYGKLIIHDLSAFGWGLITLFVLFMALLALIVNTATPAVKLDPVAQTVQASDKQTRVASGTKVSPTQKPSPTQVKTVFKIGDLVTLDDLQLTVSNVVDVPAAEYYKPKDGYRFFKFDVLFENKGTSSLYVDNHEFKVVGPDGTQYDYSYEAEQAAGLEGWNNANLLPGTKTAAGTAFEIPATQQGFKLYYDASSFWKYDLIEFDLGF